MKLDLIPKAQLQPEWFQGFQVRNLPFLIVQVRREHDELSSLLGNRHWIVFIERRVREPIEYMVGVHRIIGCKVRHVKRRLAECLKLPGDAC